MNDKYKITELKQFAESIMNTKVVQNFFSMLSQRCDGIAAYFAAEPAQQSALAPVRVQDTPRRQ